MTIKDDNQGSIKEAYDKMCEQEKGTMSRILWWYQEVRVVPPTTTAQMQRLIVVKGRARAVKTAKHTEGMDLIKSHLEPPAKPIGGPIDMKITIIWPYRKSDIGTKRTMHRNDLIPHTSKPDLDNWLKGFLDLLKAALVIQDDAKVFHLDAYKWRGPDNAVGIYIGIEGREEED